MRRASLGTRCAIASLLVVLLLGLVLSAVVQRVVHDQAAREAARSGEITASFVSSGLAPSALDRAALTPDERDALDRVVADAPGLSTLRVWARGGRVLYDSDRQPGQDVHRVGPLLERAYRGEIASQVADKGDGALLQVFVPLAGAPTSGVVELDLRHEATVARAREVVRMLAVLLVTGLAVLWAVLWWLSRLLFRALRRSIEQREELARTDALTGLPNRTALLSVVDAAYAAGTPCALLLLDLDRFRAVNSSLGHAVGDRLLADVGRRVCRAVRAQDVVARLGGDEFAVLLPGVVDPVEAVAAASRLARALADPYEVDGLVLALQASSGVALGPRHARGGSELLQRADVAMRTAKERSERTVVYDPDLDGQAGDRLLLLAELRDGLGRGELSLAYQPCYDLQLTGRCLAVEALVRWHSPTRGFVSPAEFVPLCESSGLVRQLTAFVLGEALRQLREWEDTGTVVNVAVNLSASNLAEDDLPELIAGLLAEHRVSADRVVLEITESAVIPDPVRAKRVLGRLVDLGLDIAIDDFGTGWSSMSRLLELPLSALKVDRSFVADLPSGPGAAVVSAATALAHDLGLFVVCEGIETEEQLEHAVRLGCDVGQGYLLSRPLPPHEVPAAMQRVIPHAVALAV